MRRFAVALTLRSEGKTSYCYHLRLVIVEAANEHEAYGKALVQEWKEGAVLAADALEIKENPDER